MSTEILDSGAAAATNSQIPETERIEYRTSKLDTTQLSMHWPQIAAAIQASTPDGFDKNQFVRPNVFQSIVSGQVQVWCVQAMRESPQIVMWIITRWQTDAMTNRRFMGFDALHAYEVVPDHGMRDAFETVTKFAAAGGASHLVATTSNPRLLGLANQFGADTSQRLVVWRAEE
ncbi:MAG: hypothetical protein RBU21_09310 [FCB group bacterium]|jgi:hypothetical protein|nr:hypothetical protein [FCB group bacterium]